MYVGIRVCVRVHVWVLSVYLCLYVYVGCVLQCFGPVREIRIRLWEIQNCTRYGPDTQAI